MKAIKHVLIIIGLSVNASVMLHAMHDHTDMRFSARAREAAAQANRGEERKIMVAAKKEEGFVGVTNDPIFADLLPAVAQQIVREYAFELKLAAYFQAVTTKQLELKSYLLKEDHLANGSCVYVSPNDSHALMTEEVNHKTFKYNFPQSIEGLRIIDNHVLVYFHQGMLIWDGVAMKEIEYYFGPVAPREFVDGCYLYSLQDDAVKELKTFCFEELANLETFMKHLDSNQVKAKDNKFIVPVSGKRAKQFLGIQARYPAVTACLMSHYHQIVINEAAGCCTIL
jgi:hypothetical protein